MRRPRFLTMVIVVCSCVVFWGSGCVGIPRTGQTTSYYPGDDGDLRMGVPWPTPRFRNNSDGTVTDKLTGLIWLKDANCIATSYPAFDNDETPGDGKVRWQHALDFAADINGGIYPACGAGYTDWRLPNIREILSLTEPRNLELALPSGHPFTGVQSYWYWSSTTDANDTDDAWVVGLGSGAVISVPKDSNRYVWPVRGGND